MKGTEMNGTSEKKKKWWAWHLKNPDIYRLFKRFTFEALAKNRHKHLGAWLIVNRIRWETSIVTEGDDFKISNDFIAYYARLFMQDHPEHDGLFRTKPLKEEKVGYGGHTYTQRQWDRTVGYGEVPDEYTRKDQT